MRQSLLYSWVLLCCFLMGRCTGRQEADQATLAGDSLQFYWETVETPTEASLRGLSAVGVATAWASGSQATCMMTTDHGSTWSTFTFEVPDSLQFRDVEAFPRQTVYLLSAGTPGLIYKTTDHGQQWELQYEDTSPEVFLDGMAFWDEQRGLVMGDPTDGYFTILRTDNGGRTWERVPAENLPRPTAGEAGFAASGTNIVVQGEQHAWFASGGTQARVFRSADGGRHWTAAETPIQQGKPSTGIFSLAFADTLRGVAVGGDYQSPDDTTRSAAYTTDGGRTWQLASRMPIGYRSGVACFDDGKLFIAVGTNGSDYSTDYGRTWLPLDTAAYHSIQPVPGKTAAWLSGSDGRVARLRW